MFPEEAKRALSQLWLCGRYSFSLSFVLASVRFLGSGECFLVSFDNDPAKFGRCVWKQKNTQGIIRLETEKQMAALLFLGGWRLCYK